MRIAFCLVGALGLGQMAMAAAGTTPAAVGPAADQAQVATSANHDAGARLPYTLKALEEAKAGKYGKLDRDDRRQLDQAEREIAMLQVRNRDPGTLSADEKARLFNAQESIMAVVTGLKKSQLVCTYRQNIGTRFRTKHCMTRDMAEAQKRAARESLRAQELMCVQGEGQDCMTGMQNLNREAEFQPPAPRGG